MVVHGNWKITTNIASPSLPSYGFEQTTENNSFKLTTGDYDNIIPLDLTIEPTASEGIFIFIAKIERKKISRGIRWVKTSQNTNEGVTKYNFTQLSGVSSIYYTLK